MNSKVISKYFDMISDIFRCLDVLVIITAGFIIHWHLFGQWIPTGNYLLFLMGTLVVTLNFFSWFSVYQAWRGHWLYKELTRITLAWAMVMLLIGAITLITDTGASFSKKWAGMTFILSYLGMIIVRVSIRTLLRRSRAKGVNQKRIVIVGAGVLGKRACKTMLDETWAGLKPVAFFDDDIHIIGQNYKGIEVVGDTDDLIPFIEAHRKGDGKYGGAIDQVWIALPMQQEKRIREMQNALFNTATSVFFVPDLYGFNLANYSVDEIIGLPVMNMSASPMMGSNAFLKRAEDIVLSLAMLIPLSPIMLIIAAIVKWESPGPVFFKQRRYGLDGKEIIVWKFRSMTVTEDGDKVTQATREDKRVTRSGKWLRKLSLDELPQLINVLQGRMSMVGPRPHAVAHNEFYRGQINGYMARHQMRPGITGWAQVNGCRGETENISDMEQRIRYDIEYIRNWSILLDLKIMFRTFETVTRFENTY